MWREGGGARERGGDGARERWSERAMGRGSEGANRFTLIAQIKRIHADGADKNALITLIIRKKSALIPVCRQAGAKTIHVIPVCRQAGA
jgi:hypothetical protein